jgi:hypothetical protein
MYNHGMSATIKQRGPATLRSSRNVFAAAFILLVVMFYPLSVGPALWCWSHGFVSLGTLEVIYAPVDFVSERIPTGIAELFDRYKAARMK